MFATRVWKREFKSSLCQERSGSFEPGLPTFTVKKVKKTDIFSKWLGSTTRVWYITDGMSHGLVLITKSRIILVSCNKLLQISYTFAYLTFHKSLQLFSLVLFLWLIIHEHFLFAVGLFRGTVSFGLCKYPYCFEQSYIFR